jgi:hypothetical protein
VPLIAHFKNGENMEGGRIKENDGGGVKSTMISSKNFHKCHNANPAQ